MATVAVVGAGIAGLTCGLALKADGHQVIWLEKSRGVGGRLATRRLSDGSWIDHGVRYWFSHCSDLDRLTQRLLKLGLLYEWQAQGFVWQGSLKPTTQAVYCSDRGVNEIAKHLAQGCDIRRQHRVTGIVKTFDGWQLMADSPDGMTQFQADAVIVAIPAPQAIPLLGNVAGLDAAYQSGLAAAAAIKH